MPFEPGNKLGANSAKKKQKQIKELLIHLSPKAIKALERMLDDPNHVQFATKEVLDRVWGKPSQSIDVDVDKDGPLAAILRVVQKVG